MHADGTFIPRDGEFVPRDPKLLPMSELKKRYTVFRSKKLGSGGWGTVFLGKDKSTHEKVAIKVVSMERLLGSRYSSQERKNLLREIEISRVVEHPNCVASHGIYGDDTKVFFVMEYMSGGDLAHHMVKRKKAHKPDQVKTVVHRLLRGLRYLHEKGIAHRDVKVENILIKDAKEWWHVKLADYGLSSMAVAQGQKRMYSVVGTPSYVAPEVLTASVRRKRGYGVKVDMWSLGVVCYVLLSGSFPFVARTEKKLYGKIAKCHVRFPSRRWADIDIKAIDFVKRLLTPSQYRMSAGEALKHPWIVSCASLAALPIIQLKLQKYMESTDPKAPNSKRRSENTLHPTSTSSKDSTLLHAPHGRPIGGGGGGVGGVGKHPRKTSTRRRRARSVGYANDGGVDSASHEHSNHRKRLSTTVNSPPTPAPDDLRFRKVIAVGTLRDHASLLQELKRGGSVSPAIKIKGTRSDLQAVLDAWDVGSGALGKNRGGGVKVTTSHEPPERIRHRQISKAASMLDRRVESVEKLIVPGGTTTTTTTTTTTKNKTPMLGHLKGAEGVDWLLESSDGWIFHDTILEVDDSGPTEDDETTGGRIATGKEPSPPRDHSKQSSGHFGRTHYLPLPEMASEAIQAERNSYKKTIGAKSEIHPSIESTNDSSTSSLLLDAISERQARELDALKELMHQMALSSKHSNKSGMSGEKKVATPLRSMILPRKTGHDESEPQVVLHYFDDSDGEEEEESILISCPPPGTIAVSDETFKTPLTTDVMEIRAADLLIHSDTPKDERKKTGGSRIRSRIRSKSPNKRRHNVSDEERSPPALKAIPSELTIRGTETGVMARGASRISTSAILAVEMLLDGLEDGQT